jgi:hypothetical protein
MVALAASVAQGAPAESVELVAQGAPAESVELVAQGAPAESVASVVSVVSAELVVSAALAALGLAEETGSTTATSTLATA